MTDASVVNRMESARVFDRGAARRRAGKAFQEAFQRAMHGNHPALEGREWTAPRITAACCLVGYVAVCVLVMLLMREW